MEESVQKDDGPEDIEVIMSMSIKYTDRRILVVPALYGADLLESGANLFSACLR
jgi:hypothetical protein